MIKIHIINATLEIITDNDSIINEAKIAEKNENIAYLPTNILYANLEAFIDSYIKGLFNISYLVYGDNFRREETLLLKEKIWKIIYDLNEIPKNNIEFKALVLKLNPHLDINTISDLKTLKSIFLYQA
jgi:hypothetical protein